MISAKIDSISITTIREKDIASIVDWFVQHKQSLYMLGWSYLKISNKWKSFFTELSSK